MAKLARAIHATWLSFNQTDWTLIGKDLDDMSTSLNPDVETQKNILGETIVNHSGYEPELDIDSYKARSEDAIYEKILEIAMDRKFDEGTTSAYLLEAILDKEVKESDSVKVTGQAWMENVIVVPQQYGGDTSGLDIPFNVMFNGGRTKGTVDVENRVPTFTDASGGGLGG